MRANDLDISWIASLPKTARALILNQLTEDEAAALIYDWPLWAREKQRSPDWDWRAWLILAGRGWGKALSLDTPIPTSRGWTTMGEIQIGETVFDENGQPCQVTFVSPVYFGRPCYEVVFSDGTIIVCDAEHEWLTINRRTRKALGRRTGIPSSRPQSQPKHHPSVVTTEMIRQTLYEQGEVNHAVPCTAPLYGEQLDLPIDPYVLGAWLGDGSSASAEITCAEADSEIVEYIKQAGYEVRPQQKQDGKAPRYQIGVKPPQRDPQTGRMTANGSLTSLLRQMGLLKNKHIPAIYLRASAAQRLRLLQGLMDTDGYVQEGGNCEFTTTSKALADGVYELCMTMGLKATIGKGVARLYGVDVSDKYRVSFTPYLPVCRLKRKADRLKQAGKQAKRQQRRYIVDVRPVGSVAVRCIEVDSPSHLYLASRSMIPTHNTRVGAEWVRARVERGGARRIALVARTAADARDVMIEGESGLLAVCPPWNRPIYEPSKRRLTWPNGAIAIAYSGDKPDQLRGPQHDAAWADEACAWRYTQTFDNLLFGLRLGAKPQVVITTTPRPSKWLRELMSDPSTAVTVGSTFENAANLAPGALELLRRKYEGTRLGLQELEARVLDDAPRALWKRETLEQHRVLKAPTLKRIVVAVDPAASSNAASDETGIITAGLGSDGHGYVLDDDSLVGSPDAWARAAVTVYHKYKADRVIGEANNGGEMVAHTVRTVDESVPFTTVRASRGKAARARVFTLLHGVSLSGAGRAWWTRGEDDLRDPKFNNAAILRAEYEIEGVR
jgi:phage terminase large subunit-like protein